MAILSAGAIPGVALAEGGLGDRVSVATDQTSASYGPIVGVADFTERPKVWAVRVTMAPATSLDIDIDIDCDKGDRSRGTSQRRTVNPPAIVRFKPNIKKAESCVAGATVDASEPGKLKAEMFAKYR